MDTSENTNNSQQKHHLGDNEHEAEVEFRKMTILALAIKKMREEGEDQPGSE